MPRTWTKGSDEWPRHSSGSRDVPPGEVDLDDPDALRARAAELEADASPVAADDASPVDAAPDGVAEDLDDGSDDEVVEDEDD